MESNDVLSDSSTVPPYRLLMYLNKDCMNVAETGRISLAYENLVSVPQYIADKYSSILEILDVSFNSISDLSFLTNMRCLHTLILDRNSKPNETTLPYLSTLKILWLNNCEIENIPKWINRIKMYCPNLIQLSMMGNPGSYLLSSNSNITSTAAAVDPLEYRMFIIKSLPLLERLDDKMISEVEREIAKAYAFKSGPLRLADDCYNAKPLLELYRKRRKYPKQWSRSTSSYSD